MAAGTGGEIIWRSSLPSLKVLSKPLEIMATKRLHRGKGWGPGIAKGRQLTGKPGQKRKAPSPAKGISSNDYSANFKDFHDQRDKSKPWMFWYGTTEPHRGFEFKSGVNKNGKKLSDITKVPAFWPDTDTVRHDMLDYGFEVEHYDKHLGRIIKHLEESGDLVEYSHYCHI